MKTPKQKRIWVWIVLARYAVPGSPWFGFVSSCVKGPESMAAHARLTFGPRNVRVKRVEVKP